ncbi:MAG: carbon storage regulator [Planctomycetota bacterium]
MLVLSRKVGETIAFPQLGIKIKLNGVKENSARIGVEAPRSIRVLRSELLENDWQNKDDQRKGRQDKERQEEPRRGSAYLDPDEFAFGLHAEETLDLEQIQTHIDTANLALFLARNQMESERFEYAEESLQHAIEALRHVENQLEAHPDWKQHMPVSKYVSESSSSYQVEPKTAWVVTESDLDETVFTGIAEANPGYSLEQVSACSVLQRLVETDESPALLLVEGSPSDDNATISLPGVRGYQSKGAHTISGRVMTQWQAT